MHPLFSLAAVGVAAGSLLFSHAISAQTQPGPTQPGGVTGSLVTFANSSQSNFNRLERLSAIANQATYNQLFGVCDQVKAPTAACPQASFLVYNNVRELVQTADELLNSGPTQYSLRLDAEGLGFALRWTAAEEVAAPGSASTEFANAQLASVMSRITALRFGATGFSVANVSFSPQGGGASADGSDGIPGTRWGGFLNGGFAYGKRKPTEVEDAFAFDAKDLSLGLDYRFTRNFVLGAMVGHTDQRIDFDSSQSVVDGNVDSKGFSFTAYGLLDWNGPYLSLAVEWQRLSIDITRVITYPSFNINVESVYATAKGNTNSTGLTSSLDFGWSINARAFGFDPYLRFEYRNIGIDSFQESSVNNAGVNIGKPAGFDLSYGEQRLHSSDGTVGLKIQYAFKPTFGVIVPYVRGEWHHNFDTDPFTVSSLYNGQNAGATGFDLPSDTRASSFEIYAAGTSLVFRRGWQAFVQYQTMSGISYLNHRVINGGIRGEF